MIALHWKHFKSRGFSIFAVGNWQELFTELLDWTLNMVLPVRKSNCSCNMLAVHPE